MARIVPDHSAFRKRNRFGNVTSALRLFEIARVLVRFDHVARVIRSAAKLEELSQKLKLNKPILKG
jgi:hypothetical protein